jgi:hypothetical protein
MAISLLKAIVQVLNSINPSGRASIVLSGAAGVCIIPVVPADLPKVSSPQNNETFSSVLGDLRIIGTMGLRTVTLESIAPRTSDKYPWSNPAGASGKQLVNYLRNAQMTYQPLRLSIFYANGSIYLSMLCLVDNFEFYADNVKDFHYSVTFTEYRSVNNEGMLMS